jgi:ABC-2 type transport system permease protein
VAVLLHCSATFSIGLLLSAVLPTGKAVANRRERPALRADVLRRRVDPGDLMPSSSRFLRDVTPMGAGMSAMQDAWAGGWPDGVHDLAMVAVSLVCLGVAARFFRWE